MEKIVTRYNPVILDEGYITEDTLPEMCPESDGTYVLFSEYEKLKKEHEELRALYVEAESERVYMYNAKYKDQC